MPSPACQPAQAVKSSTERYTVPAGPMIIGLSPLGPASIGSGVPLGPIWCPSGASTRPSRAAGLKPAVARPNGAKIRAATSSSQVLPAARSAAAPAMVQPMLD